MRELAAADGAWPWRLGASFLVPRSATGVGLATLFASAILPRPLSYIILYPSFRLVFGTLYPAYASYKAVRTKDVKEYVKWMMYWIVFALFTCAETFTDVFLSFWFPFYYELKIIMVIYLLSPATKGSSILYRKFVHPALTKREQEIDEYIARAKEQGYHTVLSLGSKGVNYATSILMQTAIKGGGGLVNQIRKSYSLADLPGEHAHRRKTESHDELDDSYPEGDVRLVRRQRCGSPRRTVSSGSQVDLYFPEVDVRDDVISDSFIPSHIRSSEDISSGYVSSDTSAIRQEAKEHLVRTSSVSRVRTRAATKGESVLLEEAKDSSGILVDESQNNSDHLHVPTLPLEPPPGGNVLSPFVRPHLQYLFSNLSEAELLALVTSATAQVVPAGPSKSEKCTSPSELLSTLISNDVKNEPNDKASNDDQTIEDSHSSNSLISGQTTTEPPISPEIRQSQLNTPVDVNEVARIVRRTKKRQAPVPPLGGSLIDLNRLSQISQGSDHMEISSVLDFETDFITPDSSPSRSNTSLNGNKSKRKVASDSKTFLQFPKMPFSFWPKSKTNDISREAAEVQSEKVSDVHDSFISLHEDLNPNTAQSSALQSNVVREMSQSPSFKRRLDKFS